MTQSTVEHTLIVPPTYVAEIIGVKLIRVGPRKVWATLQNGAVISVKRKDVATELEGDFLPLANKVITQYREDKAKAA